MSRIDFKKRTSQLQSQLRNDSVALLSTPNDIYYYSGFEFLVPEEREALLLVTADSTHCIQASFSPVTTPDWVHIHKGVYATRMAQHVQRICQNNDKDIRRILIDHSSLFVAELKALESALELSFDKLDRGIIWKQRMIKDHTEQKLLRKAASIAIESWEHIHPQLEVGMTELDVERILEREMLERGASGPAFPTIIAFGDHGALPHYQPGATPLKAETPILVDFGATYQGYRSDISRSFWFGENPSETFKKVQSIVHEAYDRSLKTTQEHAKSSPEQSSSEVTAASVDKAARSYITSKGYGKEFIHTTGHGLGVDIHERPSLHSANDTALKAGMAITIEPGIYIEGELGYRYENTILLTEDGADEITLG